MARLESAYSLNEEVVPVVDPGSARDPRSPLGPNSFIFMQFSAKILQNNRLAHPIWSWCPLLGNPRSATRYSGFRELSGRFMIIR